MNQTYPPITGKIVNAIIQVMKLRRTSMEETISDIIEALLPRGRGVWVPMDHPVSSFPESGLEDIDSAVDAAILGGANAIVLQKGALSYHFNRTGWEGFVCHVSASTVHGGPRSQNKVSVGIAAECKLRGASAVSGQVNLGDDSEPEMIERIGELTSDAFFQEIPVLGMFYPRGPNLVPIQSDPTGGVAHAARLAWELGCNVVKVPWTGSAESFKSVASAVPIPILISGGSVNRPFTDLLEIVEQAIGAGASGVCIGRQVFASSNPEARVRALNAIVHDNQDASEAARLLE